MYVVEEVGKESKIFCEVESVIKKDGQIFIDVFFDSIILGKFTVENSLLKNDINEFEISI